MAARPLYDIPDAMDDLPASLTQARHEILILRAAIDRAQSERQAVEGALDQLRSRYQFVASSLPQIFWSAPPDGWPDYYNVRWYEYTGLELGVDGWAWARVLHPEDLEQCRVIWTDAVNHGVPFVFECRLRRASDNTYRWHLVRGSPLLDAGGAIDIWIGTADDVDDYKRALEDLGRAHDVLEARVAQRTAELETANAALRMEIEERRRIELALRQSEQTLEDLLQERTASLADMKHRALHDVLTDLPNRVLFEDRVEQVIHDAQRHGGSVAVLLLDLDGFKRVNDTIGHHAGDILLRQIADRLRASVRASDSVARIGGDEFAVLLPETGVAGARSVAQKVVSALRTVFLVEGTPVSIGGSVGIALYPAHATGAEELRRRADRAMYAAKRSGSGYAVYSSEMDGTWLNPETSLNERTPDIGPAN